MKLFKEEDFCEVETIGSTNASLLENSENLKDGSVLTSLEQTSGKGRLGRTWSSTKGQGIFLSFLLKHLPQEKLLLLPLYVALCLKKALEKQGVEALIKWPNDIVVKGKKVGGVLCESKFLQERLHVVVGVGMNLLQDESYFQERNLPYGSSLFIQSGKRFDRRELIWEILKEIEGNWPLLIKDNHMLLEEYKKSCVNLHNQVKVIFEGEEKVGYAKDITKTGALLVQFEDGKDREVASGEVSVRGLYGYV